MIRLSKHNSSRPTIQNHSKARRGKTSLHFHIECQHFTYTVDIFKKEDPLAFGGGGDARDLKKSAPYGTMMLMLMLMIASIHGQAVWRHVATVCRAHCNRQLSPVSFKYAFCMNQPTLSTSQESIQKRQALLAARSHNLEYCSSSCYYIQLSPSTFSQEIRQRRDYTIYWSLFQMAIIQALHYLLPKYVSSPTPCMLTQK